MKIGLTVLTASAAAIIAVSCAQEKDTMAKYDDRKVIELTPEQRSYFLSEMREMMFSLNGTLAGIVSGQADLAAASAKKSGSAYVQSVGDVPPELNEQLPAEFRNFRAATHKNFDELAALIEENKTEKEIIAKLTNVTGNCASCHAMYRVVEK